MKETDGVKIRQATRAGFIVCQFGGVADLSFPTSKTRRGRVQEGGRVSPTIMSSNTNICKIERGETMGYRIRSLTPLECWRLMGFKDGDYNKAAKVNSHTQLYAQAGNAIVVNVLEAIFGQMIGKPQGDSRGEEKPIVDCAPETVSCEDCPNDRFCEAAAREYNEHPRSFADDTKESEDLDK